VSDRLSARIVLCPGCAKPVPWSTENPFRPFCSERCKLIDLGQWATEQYRVADTSEPSDVDMSEDPER
jgi:endogenous inhibitor of DNA gyrase (YacG/DUF329 family)